MSKKLLTYLLILCMTVCMLPMGILAAEETQQANVAYEENVSFLKAIGSLSGIEYENDRILTREELAQLIVCSIGYADAAEDGEGDAVIDTSFLNEKGWLWVADREESGNTLTQTEYSDVTTDMEMWQYIKLATELGLMTGENNRFRPGEDIVLSDVLYAVGRLLNFNIIKESNDVKDMMSEIYAEDILDGVAERDLNSHIRMSDVAMIVANTMKAQPYIIQFTGSGVTYKKEKNYFLMTHLFDTYFAKGVVTANKWAAMPNYTKTNDGYIRVDGVEYATTLDTDELLGHRVEVFFTEDVDYRIVHCQKSKANRESIIIDSEDIIDFSNHILTYEYNNVRKQTKIPARATIVYNGVQLNDYSDSDFMPASGRIELLQLDSGDYDLVKITKYETMMLSSVDYTNETVYAETGDLSVLSVKDYPSTEIYLANGTEVVFSTLSIDNVISVAKTIAGKQEQRLKIVVSTETVTGQIISLNSDEESIVLDETEYQFLEGYYAGANLSIQKKVILYLTSDGKVIKAKGVTEGGAKYGWLRYIKYLESNDEYRLRIFESNAKFKNYYIKEKLRFNGQTKKLKYIFAELTDDSARTKTQVIQYWTDENGNITEICTADGMDGAFSKYDLSKVGATELTHRNGGLLSFANFGFAAFLNTTGGFVSFAIPLDENDESAYGCIKTFAHEQKYTFDELYLQSKDSKLIDVCVQKGVVATTTFNSNTATPYMMVSKVMQKLDEDEEVYYSISGINTTTAVEYKCYDSDLFAQCAALNKGDIVRFNINSMDQKVEFINKVFDGAKKAMENGTTRYGDILHPYEAFNGFATTTTDNYQFLVTHRYEYDAVTKLPDMGATNSVYDKDKTRVFKYPARIVCYDSSSGEVKVGSKQDVVYSENANSGSMVVVCSYYENAQIMFVIK